MQGITMAPAGHLHDLTEVLRTNRNFRRIAPSEVEELPHGTVYYLHVILNPEQEERNFRIWLKPEGRRG
jgi:hypothetical protein